MSFVRLTVYSLVPLDFRSVCGALELGSRNIISGSVRLVWAMIYSTFVGFGILVGSDIYFLFNPYESHEKKVKGSQGSITLEGDFLSNVTYNGAMQAFEGMLTFLDASDMDASLAANQRGSVVSAEDLDLLGSAPGPYLRRQLVRFQFGQDQESAIPRHALHRLHWLGHQQGRELLHFQQVRSCL
jgi:hypothetical protein